MDLFEAIGSLKWKKEYELICLKANILRDFNMYFHNRDYRVNNSFIIELLYSEQDYKMLSDYLKNSNIEQVIDKYFEPLFAEVVNYYFDNISDSLLLENLDYIYNLTSSFDVYVFFNSNINDVSTNFDYKITNDDIINLSRDILEKIDGTRELLEIFNRKIEEKKILLYTDKKEYPEYFDYYKEQYNPSFYSPKEDIILCHNENNYDTVVSLIHEFIHMYSYLKGNNKNNSYFQEVASIFFENVAIDYLSKKFSIDKEKFKIATEREIINNDYKLSFEKHLRRILEKVKIKKKRNLKFSDFSVDKNDPLIAELFNILKPNDNYKEYITKRDKYDDYIDAYKNIGFVISGVLCNNYYSLINKHDKVLISYMLGTIISKTCLEYDKLIDLFLFITKKAESDEYSENDLFTIMMETIDKYKKEEKTELKTK